MGSKSASPIRAFARSKRCQGAGVNRPSGVTFTFCTPGKYRRRSNASSASLTSCTPSLRFILKHFSVNSPPCTKHDIFHRMYILFVRPSEELKDLFFRQMFVQYFVSNFLIGALQTKEDT